MREVVRFPINSAVEVTLQVETGEHVEGRYGDQVMYSLVDNRVMYVPPYIEQRFRQLAIGAGEPLLLCKVRDETRNRTEWSVERAPQGSVNGIAVAHSVAPVATPGPPPIDCRPEAAMIAENGEAATSNPQAVQTNPPNGKSSRAGTRLLRWHRN